MRRRLARHYVIDADTGCWLWTKSLTKYGYAKVKVAAAPGDWSRSQTTVAHRVMYEEYVGPIPEGMTLDHLCRVRHCVNPEHLEPCTRAVNTMRGDGPCARNARKTLCIHGHPLSGENLIAYTYRGSTWRACRECRRRTSRLRARRIRAAKRAAA